MPPLVPSTLLVSLLLAGPALLLTPPTSQELGVRGQRLPRDTNQNSIKVVISESCVTQGDSSNSQQGGKELDLVPGSPLVLTHRIQLIPPASGSGSCGCEADFAALRERLERLEREVSDLREKCGGTDGGCCSSKESKGAGCSIKPGIDECPNECSDQGRCVDGKCVCFPGFSGPDCSQSNCPGNCNDKGRCVNGQCVCDPGFTGPDCSQSACPDNCSNQGRCVDGKCVCDSGFSGPTCSDKACPGNCNNRGRCVNGQCVCKSGFTGPDCSERACPGNCNNRGRCVNGKCVCDSGSSGADCSEDSCPGNCNNKGRCVNGQCVCNPGFTGPDCSEKTCPDNCSDRGRCVNGKCVCDSGFEGPNCADKACPGNCNNRGRCVNGKCVCEVGFTGADCSAKACPNNCSNKGRCVKGRCVCRRGFTGPDCSECEAGMTGPNCDIEMAGVSQLETRDLTETSVTLFWTPPPVQYNIYHLVITSEKESDQQISVQVEGSRTSYTQTGLAAGQEYSATLTGEIDGRMGEASSADFMTFISSPRNLQVVKTTTTSAVVQWEQSQGEIDRYRLTVSPNDGIGSGPEMTLPPERTSAQIEQLEAGRLYDIMLVAEKGRMISEPATTQATPGKMWSLVTTATVSTQVTLAPGQDINGKGQAPDKTAPDQKGRSEDASGRDYVNVRGAVPEPKGAAANVTARKTVFTRRDGAKRPIGPGLFRLNGTRLGPGGRKFGPGPLKKPPVRKPLVGIEEKTPLDTESRKPGLPATGDEALALTVKQSSIKTSSTEKEDNENPTKITPAGINSGTDVQSSSSEPTVSHDSKEQSAEVGMKTSESATGTEAEGVVHPESSDHNGTAHTNGTCLNKIKVTHFKLPLKDRVSGGRADGVSTESSPTQPSSSEIDESGLNIPGKEHGKESSSGVETTERDPLRQLLADTFDGLKIKTFSVHLSQPSGLDLDADRMRQQIIKGLAPVSSPAAASFSSSSSSSRTSSLLPLLWSPNSLSSFSSSSTSSPQPPPPPSSTPLSSSPSSALTSLSTTPSSLLTSPSSSSSSSHASDLSDTENKPKVAKITNDERITGGGSLETKRNQTHTLREGGVPPFRRPPPAKGGYPYRQYPTFQNRTQPNLRPPPRRFQPKNAERKDTDHVHVSSSELPPSSSKESSTVDDTRTDRSGETRTVSLGLGQNQTKPWRGLVRRPPPNGGYPHRLQPHLRQFQNRTHPNSRIPHRTLKPEIPETETSLEESFSVIDSENLARTNSESEGVTPVMSIGAKRNQTTTLTAGVPPIHNPSPKVGSQRKPHPNIVSVQNRTRPNFNPPSPPHHPSSPFNPVIETEKEDVSSSEIPFLLSSSFSSKQSHPVEGTEKDGHTSRDRERMTTVVSIGPKHNQTVRGNGKPPFYRQPPNGAHPKQTHPYMARFQNRTRQILRLPHHPQKGLLHKPLPPRKINGDDGITHGIQTTGIQTNQSEAHGVHTPTHTAQTVQSGEQDTTVIIQTNRLGGDAGTTSQTGGADASHGIQITQPGESETKMNVLGEEGTIHRDSITHTGSDRDTGFEDASVNRHTASTATAPPTTKVSPDTMNHRALKPASPLKKTIVPGHTQMRNNTAMSQEGQDSKTAHPGSPKGQVSEIKDLRSGGASELHGSEDSLTEDTVGEPLDYVGVRNVGSDGFTVVWDAPEGKYTNFIVTTKEPDVKGDQPKWEEKQGQEEESDSEEDSGERGNKEDAGRGKAGNNGLREENTILVNDKRPTAGVHGSTTAEPSTGSDKNVTKVVPGTARSCQFENLPPQTPFTVTLLGKGPGLLSKLHKLVISTGPEPPSNLVFSEVTENSLTVSWTKPKNHVDAFKVTYMHTEEGEPVSVSVDSGDSTLDLSQLSPGSSYEISVISVLGLDESDPIKDLTMTLPDPPTDLTAINITDSKALLLWRPALARVDKYSIVYGSGKGSDMRVTVSGNAAEQPLKGLEGSTTYTVTITSQLGSLESSPASTAFTTTGGSGRDGPRELQASQVTPRTALLSWKPPPTAVGSYRLTYQTEGQEMKEVTVDSTVTEYKLVKLHPGAKYTASLQAESRGIYTGAISTEFTTGTLRYPFPTDCSQELLNGIRESGEAEIFLMGRPGPSLMVYCDMETDGGGWTVFQRRKDGSVDFFRGWKDYSRGFGDLTGEFWLGLDNLHNITTAIKMGLRVDLREGGEAVFAKYTNFQVAKKNFKLTVAGYSGTAGDSMTYHNGRLFSTKDRDPSPFITRCAMSYRGGWWYKNCHEANLNGVYGNDVNHQGIIWTSWKGKQHSIPFAEMKMRPAAFHPPPAQG